MLTQAELKSILSYDEITGIFTWLTRTSNRIKIGATAGARHNAGYVSIGINGELYLAHRLAWLYVHGNFPEDEIDHINGDRGNTSFANLRAATHQENICNTGMYSHNTSGYRGVTWRKDTNKWQAQVKEGSKHIALGCYETAELASEAYQSYTKKSFGKFHGSIARK